MAGQSLALDPRQRAQRIRERHLRVRPMQQQQVDLGHAQPRQALLGGSLEIVRLEVGGPDLGGEEYLVAFHAGSAHALAHLALVVVGLRGVDVAVAEP